MPFFSTKTYGHDLGLSATFRQWRAKSHCNKIHGYALSVKLTFAAKDLDSFNWVVDFGSLKPVKQLLEGLFDHKLLVAFDDPQRQVFEDLAIAGLADVIIVSATGCEKFAEIIHEAVSEFLVGSGYSPRVWVSEVEVREHGANSAIYKPEGEVK